ncbi:MAG: ABC transporter permease [Erysipelotrichaceae bacterium]|nr:ABC transporter permease [Erysipelotrichaceae bacterium]
MSAVLKILREKRLILAMITVSLFLRLAAELVTGDLVAEVLDRFSLMGLDMTVVQIPGGSLRPGLIDDLLAEAGIADYCCLHQQKQEEWTVVHCDEKLAEFFPLSLQAGSFLKPWHRQAGDGVAVIGWGLHEREPSVTVGSSVNIGGRQYRVIGILAKREESLLLDFNDSIFVPRTEGEGADQLTVFLPSSSIRLEYLLDRYFGPDGFLIMDQKQIRSASEAVLKTVRQAAIIMSAISVLVAYLGMTAVSLREVRERTGEIGIRKSLGADDRDIVLLFLGENLTVLLAGDLLADLAVMGLASLTGLKADLSASIAIVFRVTLWGMGWGLYPAFKASGISVMAAIRLKTGR